MDGRQLRLQTDARVQTHLSPARQEVGVVQEEEAARALAVRVAIDFIAERVAPYLAPVQEEGVVLFGERAEPRKEIHVLIAEVVNVPPEVGEEQASAAKVHDQRLAPALLAHEVAPAVVG